MKAFFPFLLPLITLLGLYIFCTSFFLAKRSLPHSSTCQDAESLFRDTLRLDPKLLPSISGDCWMNPSVDRLVVLVVDALRIDFAQHSLPKSFGRRLQQHDNSVLLQFLADPPTVTMQRLKGLTTGGLPTFAEISGNLGGAYVDEDSWVDLLYRQGSKLGFVGDDTWVDLFPHQWKEAHPFPSFNTRDLHTVDNGCLEYLPPLLDDLEKGELDVVVAHFLGVDHVGHTYGPHTEFMATKLGQMDEILDETLKRLESADKCIMTLVFGDHGMTEEGNHGGGTPEEVHAALFVHTSDACPSAESSTTELSQIDLVPTIALALGVPIPYASLGGLVPSLLPGITDQNTTLALALNAGQVWRYLTEYSTQANRLPLKELDVLLKEAVKAYQGALSSARGSSYPDASRKFKAFLSEATELGRRVWTRFDATGMILGGTIVGLVLIVSVFGLLDVRRLMQLRPEGGLTMLFVIFTCGILTFGNSYIENEQSISVFCLSVLCLSIFTRLSADGSREAWIALVVPIAARLQELVVTGHGLDPSIQLHTSHHPVSFLLSLAILARVRARLTIEGQDLHLYLDLATTLLLSHSWWEKRQPELDRNGYVSCRIAVALWAFGLLWSIYNVVAKRKDMLLVTIKVAIGVMIVTGPSSAVSLVFFAIQVWATERLENQKIAPSVRAFLWRLVVRHIFFATNHGCSFSRLHLSAAFIATSKFHFAVGGVALFWNTFGWDFLGLLLASPDSWKWYNFYQLLETGMSFISVSLMRRHLMVWAVFAPRFLFSAIFLILHCLGQLAVLVL